jgi:RNA polymerase sigma-70 factor (ECF subfamily)
MAAFAVGALWKGLYYQEKQFSANVTEKFAKFVRATPMTSSAPIPAARSARRFATTRWSLILQARNRDDLPARVALEELCQAYWLPVYGFMRRQTRDVHEAQDLTQGFFTSLLSRDVFHDATPARGRFRSFLLAAAKHFVCNERDKQKAAIRGGRVVLHSLDFEFGEQQLSAELSREQSAEAVFERRWALAMLDRVLHRLRDEYRIAGRLALFESLATHLSGDVREESLTEVANHLQVSSEAVRVALHRLRKRYRQVLRDEISQTADSSDEIDDEIRQLFEILRR